jgi:hypothetical protein
MEELVNSGEITPDEYILRKSEEIPDVDIDDIKLYFLMDSEIKPLIRIRFYKTLDKELIRNAMSQMLQSNRREISRVSELLFIIVGAGDRDMLQFAINNAGELNLLPSIFRGAIYDRSMLEFVPKISNQYEILAVFITTMKSYPETVILSKDIHDIPGVSDIVSATHEPRFRDRSLLFTYYEFLLQTGYYPYSSFVEAYEADPNPELKRWLAITDV